MTFGSVSKGIAMMWFVLALTGCGVSIESVSVASDTDGVPSVSFESNRPVTDVAFGCEPPGAAVWSIHADDIASPATMGVTPDGAYEEINNIDEVPTNSECWVNVCVDSESADMVCEGAEFTNAGGETDTGDDG